MRRTALAVLLGAAVGAAGVVVAARAFGWQAGPLYFLVALTPYAGIALVVLAAVAAAARLWWLAAVAIVAALPVAGWWWPAFHQAPVSDPALDVRVMTVNLQFGRGDPAAVVAAARAHDVDLIAVQELTAPARAALAGAGLDDAFPYRFVRTRGVASPAGGTGMWSRYPLSDRTQTRG